MKFRLLRKNKPSEFVIISTTGNRISRFADVEFNGLTQHNGYYDFIDDKFVAIYKFDSNSLRLIVDNIDIIVDELLSIEYQEDQEKYMAILKIARLEQMFYLTYDISKMKPISTTYYSEDYEDSNFGLWCYSVLNSKERKVIVLSSWD